MPSNNETLAPIPSPSKTRITEIAKFGDSLSDSGVMDHRKLFFVFSMAILTGLRSKSPLGRFTNGYVWSDDFDADLANEFLIQKRERGTRRKRYILDSADRADYILSESTSSETQPKSKYFNAQSTADIADDIIDGSLRNSRNYNLDSPSTFQYQGRDFVKNYAEGGLTAANYRWLLSSSITRFFTRLVVRNLADKRQEFLADDKRRNLTQAQKASKLIIEWSGANDLLTVNKRPSRAEVDKAIAARIENINELIKNGYQNFALYNLPDLSLTPRFQCQSAEEQQNAHDCSMYFNQQLAKACEELQRKYPYFKIVVININKKFEEIYANPAAYGLNPALKNQPFQDSPDFKNKDRISHDPDGHIFWDKMHPTARVQKLLEEEVLTQLDQHFEFKQPHEITEKSEVINLDATELYNLFKNEYTKQLNKDKNEFIIGFFRRSNLKINFKDPNIDPKEALKEIFKHGLYQNGNRTKDVMMHLKWIDKNGNLLLNIPALKHAKWKLDWERTVVLSAPSPK